MKDKFIKFRATSDHIHMIDYIVANHESLKERNRSEFLLKSIEIVYNKLKEEKKKKDEEDYLLKQKHDEEKAKVNGL